MIENKEVEKKEGFKKWEVIPGQSFKKRKPRVLRPSAIIKKKRENIDIGGEIGSSIGLVEKGTKIFITGRSYSGKSSFIFKLCKAFAENGIKVDYNNHEEKGGDAGTVKSKLELAGIEKELDSMIRFYKAPIVSDTELTWDDILSKKQSAGFSILDSVQHAQLNRDSYIALTDKFCNAKKGKILAFICHWVKNDYMKFIRHDCDVKLEVMHFTVYVESRLDGATNKPIVIWEEAARKAWGKNYKKVIDGKYWPGIKR